LPRYANLPEFSESVVTVEIKFCGLTRPEDAAYAASVGASYVGVIFAGGPRMLTVEQAAVVLGDVPDGVRRVGVFADQTPTDIARIVGVLGLSVVQLHGDVDAARIKAVRSSTNAAIWPVIRVAGDAIPSSIPDLLRVADGLLLDAFVPGSLGGNGIALPWTSLANELRRLRGPLPIILAGGLRPENVGDAIVALAPDVVDVSSGVERAPGIKDHERMRAFRDAVSHASIPT
jgi:phosphoribosylanthranilate isomerase